MIIDRRRMIMPGHWTGVLDVHLEGRRVWSLRPERHPLGAEGRRRVAWPSQLQPYLVGSGTVKISTASVERPLVEREVRFDDADSRVAVVDADGRPLALDKLNRLTATFDDAVAEDVDALLGDVAALIETVTEVIDAPAFLAYGGLLGAVRSGRLIGHDNDLDIAYLSRYRHPAGVVTESYALQRGLRRRGWHVHTSMPTFLQVRRDGAPANRRIDIFTGHYADFPAAEGEPRCFALATWVRGDLALDDLLPLGTVELAGRSLPAPAVPERLLELTYGPGWRTPDPSFRFETPTSTSRRAFGWFGRPVARDAVTMPAVQRAPGPDDPLEPSPYARWVDEQAPPGTELVDLRIGTGPDPFWWAANGRQVRSYDLKDNSRTVRLDPGRAPGLTLTRLVPDDLRRMLAAAAGLGPSTTSRTISLGRVLPALRPEARRNVWRFVRVAQAWGPGGLTVLAVGPDELDPVEAEVQAEGGHVVECTEAGDDTVHLRAHWP